MKREDVLGLFPEATPEQVDAILDRAGAEINAVKAERDKALGDAASLAKAQADLEAAMAERDALKASLDEANAKVQAGMTAEEIIAQREAEADRREREFVVKSNALDAKAAFVESGLFEDGDIAALVEQVATEDAEVTAKRANLLVEAVRKAREAAETATRDALLKGNPKLGEPGAGGSAGGMPATLADFLSLSEQQQLALKAENPGILSELAR